MSSPTPVLAAGATAPALLITLTRSGAAVDLTTASSVTARIQRPGLTDITGRNCPIQSPATAGQIKLSWATGDLQNSEGSDLQYLADFAIAWADGTTEYPMRPLEITVRAALT